MRINIPEYLSFQIKEIVADNKTKNEFITFQEFFQPRFANSIWLTSRIDQFRKN